MDFKSRAENEEKDPSALFGEYFNKLDPSLQEIVNCWTDIQKYKNLSDDFEHFSEISSKSQEIYLKYFSKRNEVSKNLVYNETLLKKEVLNSPNLLTFDSLQKQLLQILINNLPDLTLLFETEQKNRQSVRNVPTKRVPSDSSDTRRSTSSGLEQNRKGSTPSSSPFTSVSSIDGHLDSIFESDGEDEGSDPEIPSLSSHLSKVIKNKHKSSFQHRLRNSDLDEEDIIPSIHEDNADSEEEYPFIYSLTKTKTDSIQILEQYFNQMSSNSWLCHIHIKAHINAWKLFSFENSDSVQEAIQTVVETLSDIHNQKLNWRDYIFSFPDQNGRVKALPYNAILKSYGRDEIELIRKDEEAYPQKTPTSLPLTQDNSNITLSLNTLHNLLQASPNYEIIQTSLVDIESKFNHAKKLLDFCLLEIATFLDNEPDENMDELQNKVEILQKENEKLRKENEQLKSNRSLPPVEPPAPELEVQLEEDTSLTKSVRRRKPSLDKIQPSVFKRNSLRKSKKLDDPTDDSNLPPLPVPANLSRKNSQIKLKPLPPPLESKPSLELKLSPPDSKAPFVKIQSSVEAVHKISTPYPYEQRSFSTIDLASKPAPPSNSKPPCPTSPKPIRRPANSIPPFEDVNVRDENGLTPLHLAAQSGNIERLKQILTVPGVNVNCSDYGGWTPLHYAAQGGFKDIVEVLLSHPLIDPNQPNKMKKYPKDLTTSKEIIHMLKNFKIQKKKEVEMKKKEKESVKKLPNFKSSRKEKIVDPIQATKKPTRKGIMLFSDGGKWKQSLVTLSNQYLVIDLTTRKSSFDLNSEPRKSSIKSSDILILSLAEIVNIEHKEMDSTDVFEEMDPHTDGTVFGIFLNSSKPIFFRAKNRTDRNQWMLSIDSLIANSSLYLIPELERNSLLKEIFKDQRLLVFKDSPRSGTITSSEGEIWTYAPDSSNSKDILKLQGNTQTESIEYIWNGKYLAPIGATNLGAGLWDGLSIAWLSSTSKVATLSYVFLWNEVEQFFYSGQGEKWTIVDNKIIGIIEDKPIEYVARDCSPTPPLFMFLPLLKKVRLLSKKYEKLTRMLLSPEIILHICDLVPILKADELAEALINVFEFNKATLHLLKEFINHEINSETEEFGILLRSNSVASKLMKFYSRLVGQKYLQKLFAPLIKSLDGKTFEVDPQHLTPDQNLETNIQNLVSALNNFLKAITSSIDICPDSILEICGHLGKIVGQRFPGKQLISIGGYMFLRFLIPAFLFPQANGISTDPLSENTKRGLVLIGKILQNLSNGGFAQEHFMEPFNNWVKENTNTIKYFFEQLQKGPASPPSKFVSISQDMLFVSMNVIHNFFSSNLESIQQSINNKPLLTVKQILQFIELLEEYPSPPELGLPKKQKMVQKLSQKNIANSSASINNNNNSNSTLSPSEKLTQSEENEKKIVSPKKDSLLSRTFSKKKVEKRFNWTFDEFWKFIGEINSDIVSNLVGSILKEFEKNNKLQPFLEVIFKDAPQELIFQVLKLNFDLILKINNFFGNKLNSPLAIASLESQLWTLPKDLLYSIIHLILYDFSESTRIYQLLETLFGDHVDTKQFQFTFLLTLARTNFGEIVGVGVIRKFLDEYFKKRSTVARSSSTSPSTNGSSSSVSSSENSANNATASANFIDSTLEELCIKLQINKLIYETAFKENPEAQATHYAQIELQIVEDQMSAICCAFNKNPSFFKRSLSEAPIKHNKKFWCATCQKLLLGGGYVLTERERFCKLCFKS